MPENQADVKGASGDSVECEEAGAWRVGVEGVGGVRGGGGGEVRGCGRVRGVGVEEEEEEEGDDKASGCATCAGWHLRRRQETRHVGRAAPALGDAPHTIGTRRTHGTGTDQRPLRVW